MRWFHSVTRQRCATNPTVAPGPTCGATSRPPPRSRHLALERTRSTCLARPCAGVAVQNRRRDLVEITASELDYRRPDPAVHLLRCAGADNGSAHPGPREGPSNGDARHRGFVPLRDG